MLGDLCYKIQGRCTERGFIQQYTTTHFANNPLQYKQEHNNNLRQSSMEQECKIKKEGFIEGRKELCDEGCN
jgi:hypothetical protein